MEKLEAFLNSVNNSGIKLVDKNGKLLQGENLLPGIQFDLPSPVIIRTDDEGFIDGTDRIPAVEYPGYIEFWVHGKRDRGHDLPAVCKNGFGTKQWWSAGKFIYEKKEETDEKE